MRDAIERAVDTERFNMNTLRKAVWPLLTSHPRVVKIFPTLTGHFKETMDELANAIFRHAFLIELVKTPKIESTKFRCRWYQPMADGNDLRWCSFDECVEIASDLFDDMCGGWLATADHAEAVKLCFSDSLVPYEVPLDYVQRPIPGGPASQRIHRQGNLKWTCTDKMLRTLKLRSFLTRSDKSPDRKFFTRVLGDKIQVKAYLTDRVLTGEHKTNREKRWEVHPYSVHFAFRRTCMEIEYRLIEQLCTFDGFPIESRAILEREKILPRGLPIYRCPVTQDKLSFDEFHRQLTNPVAGESDFQVGHLNALKLDDPTAAASGHTAENISWISAEGNRVQGDLGIVEVQAMIRRIAKNYDELGIK